VTSTRFTRCIVGFSFELFSQATAARVKWLSPGAKTSTIPAASDVFGRNDAVPRNHNRCISSKYVQQQADPPGTVQPLKFGHQICKCAVHNADRLARPYFRPPCEDTAPITGLLELLHDSLGN